MERFKEIKEEVKTIEEVQIDLSKSRGAYAVVYTEYRKAFGGLKKEDLQPLEKTIEPIRKWIQAGDSEKIKSEKEEEFLYAEERKNNFIKELARPGINKEEAEAIYEVELKKAEYDAAKVELGKKMAEQGIQPAEIFQKLVLSERELLNQVKVESWPPKEKGIFRKGMEWYMRRGTATRLLISTGLVTGAVAGVGGFGAAAAATYAGYRFVRGFGSVMVGKLAGNLAERMMSKTIASEKEAALNELQNNFSLDNLKNTDKNYQDILKKIGKMERRKVLAKGLISMAAGMGTAIGMGILEKTWAGGGVKSSPEAIKPKAGVPESAPKISSVVEVQKGDTVWKLSKEQLENRGYFKNLIGSADEITAKKNFLIDSVSRKVSVSSGDANLIHAGEKIDFKDIFENKDTMAQLVDKSEHLKPMGVGHIAEHLQKPEIETGAAKNVFEFFDKQTRPEKWGTIQSYQHDIDSMKGNLDKFTDPQVRASVQAEIDRLENIKQSLIHRLAEQTEQIPPEIKVSAAEAGEHILPPEKQSFFDNLIYKDTLPKFKVDALVEQIKTDKLTAEDFADYYADAKEFSEGGRVALKDNFEKNFKAIFEGNAKERNKALIAMETIIVSLEKMK
ncbi:MAG: hypothetical protein HY773_00105 [Candidatus Terrybacteria bacterium]|nr:hypothetical protein [Candidatus Terrybacteria bacterium]